jgi:hypothetical protein
MEPGRFCFFAHGSGKTHFYRSGNTMEIVTALGRASPRHIWKGLLPRVWERTPYLTSRASFLKLMPCLSGVNQAQAAR